jgi:hypothetical protein
VAAVAVEHDGHGRLLPDPDREAGDALHEQGLQGVRAAVAGARVRRARRARAEEGCADQVPQVRAALRRAASVVCKQKRSLIWLLTCLHLGKLHPRMVYTSSYCVLAL